MGNRDQLQADGYFAIVPEWVLYAHVSDRAVRLYAVLRRHADKRTLQAYPARATLARELHCSKNSVDRAMAELLGLGAVHRVRRYLMDGERHVLAEGDTLPLGAEPTSSLYTLRTSPPVGRGSPTAETTRGPGGGVTGSPTGGAQSIVPDELEADDAAAAPQVGPPRLENESWAEYAQRLAELEATA